MNAQGKRAMGSSENLKLPVTDICTSMTINHFTIKIKN